MKEAVAEIPGVLQLSMKVSGVSDVALELLAWVLDDPSFKLCTKNKSEYNIIKKLTGHMTSVPDPSYIFEMQYGDTGEKKFQTLQDGRPLMYAYHGSRVENFHSILHNGLAGHMNKMSLFGKGTYLSSELAVSMLYSPGGQGWKKSQLGGNLGCVAVCQMIDDTSVKCTVKEGGRTSTEGEDSRNRARATESLAGDVPERYYVVENNDMVRVKYLLIYSQPSTARTQSSALAVPWYRKNKFAVMMAIYMLLLLCVGLFSSKSFQLYIRRGLKSYGFGK